MTLVGRKSNVIESTLEASQTKLFAKAIGETSSIYWDAGAARAQGYDSALAPPTFGFCVGMDDDALMRFVVELGLDPAKLLHAGQRFEYHEPLYIGDITKSRFEVVGDQQKRNGTLRFIRLDRAIFNQFDRLVVQQTVELVERHHVAC